MSKARNWAIMSIHQDVLLDLICGNAHIINLPEGVNIIAVHNDYEHSGIALKLEHESFADIPVGGMLPNISATYELDAR